MIAYVKRFRVQIHSKTRKWHDNNIKSNAPYRLVPITQLSQAQLSSSISDLVEATNKIALRVKKFINFIITIIMKSFPTVAGKMPEKYS